MAEFIPNSRIPDVVLVKPCIFGDRRGFFLESYRKDTYEQGGISVNFVQDNHSKSSKGVLRGLHFQVNNPQAKLVRVVRGAVLDVAVDIRKDSVTYGQYVTEVLTAENGHQLFIPHGFAHGFLTLENDTEFLYKCDAYYDPSSDGGILWNDPRLGLPWDDFFRECGIEEPVLSEKDLKHPTLVDLTDNPF